MTADVVSLITESETVAMLAVRVAVLLVLLSVADHLIERRPFFGRPFWALVDSVVHGAVALPVTAPILQSPQLLVLAFLAGTLVDVDHFLAGGFRSFQAATQLEKRPPTHSVTFALLVGGGGYVFSGSFSAAWIVFAALTSHVLRDASVGTAPVLWPLGDWRMPRWGTDRTDGGFPLHHALDTASLTRGPLMPLRPGHGCKRATREHQEINTIAALVDIPADHEKQSIMATVELEMLSIRLLVVLWPSYRR